MKAVIELERQGYSVSLKGECVQVERKVGFSPDAGSVKILLQEIKEKKSEAVRYLKQRRMSVWCNYKGFARFVSWDACLWHREANDPACQGCSPERRPQSERNRLKFMITKISIFLFS